MARPHPKLHASLQGLFVSRTQFRDAAAASEAGASLSESGGDFVELALTREELPHDLNDACGRTLALVAGTPNARDKRRILEDHYSMFAIYETNLLWCPHSMSIAAWTGWVTLLTMADVEGIRCHRVVLRSVASETSSDVDMQMQMDVTFAWRPLHGLMAPLRHLLLTWGVKGPRLPSLTTEHTITLTINPQGRVVLHRDITHNFPCVPLLLKRVLGLATPFVATLLHV
ncbi:hypothetical protein VaNZ11_008212 [Volvox africanus]|uniref:Uncharacterized protein n=1 Tax=Volvox africanus TaxID=51714 RepID=A0ABQ5S5E9_9CHLO|nr:hypothetical protein VaNZ11_008212 [Volvox africanus]